MERIVLCRCACVCVCVCVCVRVMSISATRDSFNHSFIHSFIHSTCWYSYRLLSFCLARTSSSAIASGVCRHCRSHCHRRCPHHFAALLDDGVCPSRQFKQTDKQTTFTTQTNQQTNRHELLQPRLLNSFSHNLLANRHPEVSLYFFARPHVIPSRQKQRGGVCVALCRLGIGGRLCKFFQTFFPLCVFGFFVVVVVVVVIICRQSRCWRVSVFEFVRLVGASLARSLSLSLCVCERVARSCCFPLKCTTLCTRYIRCVFLFLKLNGTEPS